jgi:PAS domain S-box-containing protein
VNQKKSKNSLLQSKFSEAFYKLFFEHNEEAVLVLTFEGEILAGNAAAEKLLGYPAQKLQQLILKDLFFDPQQCEQFFVELRNGERVTRQLAPLKKRNGETCRGLISLLSIVDGSERPFLIVATFSRKTRSENLLQKERNFISAILETTGALVVLLDPQYRFIRINNAFEKLTGYTIIDLLGIFIWDMILPQGEMAGFKDVLKKLDVNRPPLEHRCRITGSDGGEYVVIWNIAVMAGEDNKPEYLICTGIDVTELQKALAWIKNLSGLLPICSFCKKIRNDQGHWEVLEAYIRDHSEANFSHGLCPECLKIHYPEYSEK